MARKNRPSTEVEVFMENGVRGRARTAGANSRRDATKKREISRNLFSINLHSWVEQKRREYLLGTT